MAATRRFLAAANRIQTFVHQYRAAIDQTGVELHQARARRHFLHRIGAGENAAYADDRNMFRQPRAQHAQHRGRFRHQRFARQTAGFFRQRVLMHRDARHRGVSGDHAVHAHFAKHPRGDVDVFIGQIRRHFHQHRYAAAMDAVQTLLRFAQDAKQFAQLLFFLQFAQAGGVRRRDINRDVVGQRVDFFQADQIIQRCRFIRRVFIFADIDAENAVAFALRVLHVAHQRIDAVVVEAETIDDRVVLRQTKHPRLGIAFLRLRRDRADFDETEAQREQCVDMRAVLIQSGRQADRIGKGQAQRFHREGFWLARQQRTEPGAVCRFQHR